MNPNASRTKIVFLGGGFAGLETAYALRSAMPDQADITLISNRPTFLFRPHTIYIPFGVDEDQLLVDIAKPARRREIRFVEAHARAADPVRRVIAYERDGQTHHELYDYLVVATGAQPHPEEIPGLTEHGHSMGSVPGMVALRNRLNHVLERAKYGKVQRIVLALPPHAPYTTPVYELTFMLDSFLRDARVREQVNLTLVTHESQYIESFGPLLHNLIQEQFETRGIENRTGSALVRVEAGVAHFDTGDALPFDLLAAFPPASASVAFPGLPADERGYLHTHLATRHVHGLHGVFAAGDTSDFPIRQAFVALLQADAIAEGITADVQGRAPRFVFEPVSKFVMEEFDTGLYAQTPFSTEGGLHVDLDSPEYKAGASPLWRIGKRMLGNALPRRFSQGEPFNAGLPSLGIDMGVKVLSGVAAGRRRESTPTPN